MTDKMTLTIGVQTEALERVVGGIADMAKDGLISPDAAQRIAGLVADNAVSTVVSPEKAPDANVEANRKELLDRSRVGLQKYGVTTERNDLSIADWLQHALEEALDLANYLQRAKRDAEVLKHAFDILDVGVAMPRDIYPNEKAYGDYMRERVNKARDLLKPLCLPSTPEYKITSSKGPVAIHGSLVVDGAPVTGVTSWKKPD